MKKTVIAASLAAMLIVMTGCGNTNENNAASVVTGVRPENVEHSVNLDNVSKIEPTSDTSSAESDSSDVSKNPNGDTESETDVPEDTKSVSDSDSTGGDSEAPKDMLTPAVVMKNCQQAIADAKSGSYDATITMTMSADVDGTAQSSSFDSTVKGSFVDKNGIAVTNINLADGQSTSVTTYYADNGDGTIRMYSDENGAWTYTDIGSDISRKGDVSAFINSDFSFDYADGVEMRPSGNMYYISCDMSKAMGETNIFTDSVLSDMGTDMSGVITYAIDGTTWLPYTIKIDNVNFDVNEGGYAMQLSMSYFMTMSDWGTVNADTVAVPADVVSSATLANS